MKLVHVLVPLLALAGVVACSSTPADVDAASSEDTLKTAAGTGTGSGGLVDPGPTYCPTVDPLCALCPGDDTKSAFDEALVAAGCSPEKVHVNADSGKNGTWVQAKCTLPATEPRICKGGIGHYVSYCPNTRTVAAIVANDDAYNVIAGSSTTICDKCLFRPESGKTWVYWQEKVFCPNCGSGCKPPAW